MSKCKPQQDEGKIFRLDALSENSDGAIEERSIEPIGLSALEESAKTAAAAAKAV